MKLPNENAVVRSRSSLLALTLFVSVLLNLFLAGAFLGVVPGIKHKVFGPMALTSPHSEYMVDWMVRYLNPKDADAFQNAFKAEAGALKQAHGHVRQAMNNVVIVFEQESPDPAALETAIGELNKAKGEVEDVVGEMLQSAYIKLSPEGRRRLADLAQNPM